MTQATLSVARLVPDGERMNFLPKAFGSRLMLRGEISVYNWLDRLSHEYSGGFWHYYEIPNGFYMAPADMNQIDVHQAATDSPSVEIDTPLQAIPKAVRQAAAAGQMSLF